MILVISIRKIKVLYGFMLYPAMIIADDIEHGDLKCLSLLTAWELTLENET